MTPDPMVTRLETAPAPVEAFIFQPPMSTGEAPGLYSSINSSSAPLGPRVRNSLMSTAGSGVTFVGVPVGVIVGVLVMVFVGVGVGVLVGVEVGATHGLAGEALLRGAGSATLKSAELLSV